MKLEWIELALANKGYMQVRRWIGTKYYASMRWPHNFSAGAGGTGDTIQEAVSDLNSRLEVRHSLGDGLSGECEHVFRPDHKTVPL